MGFQDLPAYQSALLIKSRISELASAGERASAWEDRHRPGGFVMVSRDPSKPGAWRATYFEADGTPAGHTEAPDHARALRVAYEDGADLFKPIDLGAVKGALRRLAALDDGPIRRDTGTQEFYPGVPGLPEPLTRVAPEWPALYREYPQNDHEDPTEYAPNNLGGNEHGISDQDWADVGEMCGLENLTRSVTDSPDVTAAKSSVPVPAGPVVKEYGQHFETGVPVEFGFVRNTVPSGYFGETYQQHIEPAGRYMVHNPDPGDLPSDWEKGTVRFDNPLVLEFNAGGTGLYDETSWKAELSRRYGGKTGKALTKALLADGYDGVVTVDVGSDPRTSGTREVVDLRGLRGPGKKRQGARPIPLDMAEVDRLVEAAIATLRKTFSDARRPNELLRDQPWFGPRWALTVGRANVTDVRGAEWAIPVWLTGEEVAGVRLGRAYISGGELVRRRVGVGDPVPWQISLLLNGARTPALFLSQETEVRQELRSVLLHELTHAADVIGGSTAQPEGEDRSGYHNDPAEVRAFGQQIVDEVVSIVKARRKSLPRSRDLGDTIRFLLGWSPTWGRVEADLTSVNRKLLLKMVYQAVEPEVRDYWADVDAQRERNRAQYPEAYAQDGTIKTSAWARPDHVTCPECGETVPYNEDFAGYACSKDFDGPSETCDWWDFPRDMRIRDLVRTPQQAQWPSQHGQEGGFVLVHKDTSHPGKWRATSFMASGEPWGHADGLTYQGALEWADSSGADLYGDPIVTESSEVRKLAALAMRMAARPLPINQVDVDDITDRVLRAVQRQMQAMVGTLTVPRTKQVPADTPLWQQMDRPEFVMNYETADVAGQRVFVGVFYRAKGSEESPIRSPWVSSKVDLYSPEGHIGVDKLSMDFEFAGGETPMSMLARLADSRDDLRSKVAHEMTHLRDVISEIREYASVSSGRRAKIDYYNDPAEVKAFMRQVVDDVVASLKGLPARHYPTVRDALDDVLDLSFSWQRIREFLTPENRKKILSVVYQALEGAMDEQGDGLFGDPVSTESSEVRKLAALAMGRGRKTASSQTFQLGIPELEAFYKRTVRKVNLYTGFSDPARNAQTLYEMWADNANEGDAAYVEGLMAQFETAGQQAVALVPDGLYVDLRELTSRLLTFDMTEFDGVRWPIILYVSAGSNDPQTIGVEVDPSGKPKMFEGNDEATGTTIDLVNQWVAGDQEVQVWGSHDQSVVDQIRTSGMLPPNLYVSPRRQHAAGYWGDGRQLFTGVIKLRDVSQESDVDWRTLRETPIGKVKLAWRQVRRVEGAQKDEKPEFSPEVLEQHGWGLQDGKPISTKESEPLLEYRFAGLPIVVENPAGTIRHWESPDGTSGDTHMLFDYGYIDGFLGADGDAVDVYVGPEEDAPYVYVIRQMKVPEFNVWDEDKVALGFPDENAAKGGYLAHYDDERFCGGIATMTMARFVQELEKRRIA